MASHKREAEDYSDSDEDELQNAKRLRHLAGYNENHCHGCSCDDGSHCSGCNCQDGDGQGEEDDDDDEGDNGPYDESQQDQEEDDEDDGCEENDHPFDHRYDAPCKKCEEDHFTNECPYYITETESACRRCGGTKFHLSYWCQHC